MIRKFAFIVWLVAAGCSAPTGKKFRTVVSPLPERSPVTNVVSLSDEGVMIRLRWADDNLKPTSVMMFDGTQNPVLNLDYSILSGMDVFKLDTTTDSLSALIEYRFNPRDSPGIWRLVWKKDAEEIFDCTFTVEPRGKDPTAYANLDCYLADGRIDRRNFYQMSDEEVKWFNEPPDYELIAELAYAIKRRATKCLAPEYNGQSIEAWQDWLQKLSGVKVRQRRAAVHERISKVMPVAEEEFFLVNAEFVTWFSANLIPRPAEEQFNGFTFQAVYDKFLQEKVRNLALVGLYYFTLPNDGLDDQVAYAEMASRHYLNVEEERVMERHDYNNISAFISEKHEAACNDWIFTNVVTGEWGDAPLPFTTIYMGFWLRRGIDGSAPALWAALRQILKDYDPMWYDGIIKPRAAL